MPPILCIGVIDMNKDRNCGLCGEKSCEDFRSSVKAGRKQTTDCPFYKSENVENGKEQENVDFHNNVYDFMLKPIGDEPSARKIIRPFRTDLIEKLDIKAGDIVVGRPITAAEDPVAAYERCVKEFID